MSHRLSLIDTVRSTRRGAHRGRHAADRVGAAVRSVGRRWVKTVLADVRELVQAHPGKATVAAATVGLLVARVFRTARPTA